MKLKRFIYYFLIALMISSIVMLLLTFIKEPTIRKENRLSAIPEENIEINKEKSLNQYFQVQMDSINIIKLYVDNVSDTNGYLKISFYNSNNKELSTKSVELKEFVTPGINFIYVDNLNNLKNEIIKLKIEVIDSDSNVSIGVNDEYYENQYIEYNDNKINKSIIMYYEGNTRNISLIVHFVLIFFVSLLLAVFLREEVIQERNDKDEKVKRK